MNFDYERFLAREVEQVSRSSRYIVGGSLTRSKAPGKFYDVGAGPHYVGFRKTDGATIYSGDFGDHPLVDMLCGLGAISLGYGRAPCQVDVGTSSLPNVVESVAASLVVDVVAPWATRVRFVKTGSEATHAAYRIAKRSTGRKKTLVGVESYHGWHEWCERQPDGTPEHPDTILYSHKALSENALFRDGEIDPSTVAAIFVEPHRWDLQTVEWFKWIRYVCDRYGILLVFDEMIYGGRWAIGGASEYFGVTPDLACYGKAFGNGASVAFVVGTGAMECSDIVSGTYSGDAVGLCAAVAVISHYKKAKEVGKSVIETLWARGSQLRRGLRELVRDDGPIVGLEGAPVHQRFKFRDVSTGLLFCAAMAKRGVLMHPACINVCESHTTDQIENAIDAAFGAEREIRASA